VLNAGCDGYLMKPLSRSQLVDGISRVLNLARG
jgi:DNA-binding NarL/FixJ family response regulator